MYKGQPAKGAIVALHPKDSLKDAKVAQPTGSVNDDGTFSLMTNGKPGAPEGEYVVTVLIPKEQLEKGSRGPENLKLGIPAKSKQGTSFVQGSFADASQSTIKVTIKSGKNQLEPFNLQ